MIDIRLADPAAPEMLPLLEAHLAHSKAHSPDGSDHALTPQDMRAQGMQFWAVYDGDCPVACGGLVALPDGTAEVKSVHVAQALRGRGVAKRLMDHLAEEARAVGYKALVLETGSSAHPGFEAARALYEALGYEYCAPFGDYVEDPASVFMRLLLRAEQSAA